MFIHEEKIRVRYAETDQMGYVYYGNYGAYYEVARTEMLRKTGFSYKELEEMGIMMPVLEMNIRYFQPAKYDELLTIKVIIKEKPKVRIKFEYEVYNQQEILLNKGTTELVFVNMEKNRPCLAPDIFLSKMYVQQL